MRTICLLLLWTASFGLTGMAAGQFFGHDNMNRMEHGPFATSTISLDPLSSRGILAHKGVAVKVGEHAVMVFDTDLLRVAGAWTGGFLEWYPARDGLQEWPGPGGFMQFSTGHRPGWSSRNFEDPRTWPYGPLPEDWGRYEGLFLHDDRVVFSYSLAGADVLEAFGFTTVQGTPVFTRTIRLDPGPQRQSLLVVRSPDGAAVTTERVQVSDSTGYLRVRAGEHERLVAYRGLPDDAAWRLENRHLILDLPQLDRPLRFEVAIGGVTSVDASNDEENYAEAYIAAASPIADLAELSEPARPKWDVLETEIHPGAEDGPFAVDELAIPVPNPWNSHLRLTDVDFLPDGRAVVASLSGDVWIVDGIEQARGTLRWKRYATGLFQPLGVKVVDEHIYVTGRDQITILHDRDGNGEADYYQNFNNEVMASTNFHAFTMNLETDSEGNFYFAKATPWPPVVRGVPAEITPHHGVLFKLPHEGGDLEIVATGLRNPNGLTIGPNDEIIYADNEGNWIPTSMLQRIRRDGFHGFVPSAHLEETPAGEDFHKPIVWLPHFVDNSPAKPIFIDDPRWPGELQGDLLLASYGRGTLSLVLLEEVDGIWQGAHVRLPLHFQSGLERARFHDDGHLYVAGLTSWQSVGHGGDWGSLHRVRYTGEPLHLPVAVNTRSGGLELRFSEPLDASVATNPETYDVRQWTYPWSSQYGTRGWMYSVLNPGQTEADAVVVRSVRLSDDRRTVYLDIPSLTSGPVGAHVPRRDDLPDQIQAELGLVMSIEYDLSADDGTPLHHVIHKTIHHVPNVTLGESE